MFARGLVKLLAIALGGAVTVVALMSAVGAFVDNGWIRLAVAVLVAIAVPAILADRLLPEDTGKSKGIVTDVFAMTWLGFGFAFVVLGISLTQPLLQTEAQRLANADLATLAQATHWLAGSSPDHTGAGESEAIAAADPAGQSEVPKQAAQAPSDKGESAEASGQESGDAKSGSSGSGAQSNEASGDEVAAKTPDSGKDKPKTPSSDERKTPAEIFKTWAPSVLTVSVQKGVVGGGGGTGFLIGSDGTMVTNHHVIDGADDVRVKLMDGTWADAVELLAQDEKADIAILRIKASGALDPVRLGDSDTLVVGERAISIGNPLGLEHTLTDGLISARRKVRGRRMIQMSTPISPGNSGGPLFNLRGEVVGVSTATMSAFGAAQNLNLAVPINTVKSMLKDDYPDKKRIGGGGPDMGRW